jgi:hypothetical protein
MNFGNLSISNTICTAALTTIAFTKQQWCSWRMCPKGCAVDYDKYSKMLAINTNHKDDDPDFNEFVPATTEAEYINLKLKMATMKRIISTNRTRSFSVVFSISTQSWTRAFQLLRTGSSRSWPDS